LALGDELGRIDVQAHAHWGLMLLHMNVEPDAKKAIEHGEEALRIARELGLRELEAFVLNDIGRAYSVVGRPDDAFRAYKDAHDLWEESGNEPMTADLLSALGTVYLLYGDLSQAENKAREGLEVSRLVGAKWGLSVNEFTLGLILLEKGEFSEAIRLLESAIEWAIRANFLAPQMDTPIILSWVFGSLGDYRYRFEWREKVIVDSGAEQSLPAAWSIWLLIEQHFGGDVAGAYELARQIVIPPLLSAGQDAIFVSLIIAEVFLSRGRFQDALELTDRTLSLIASLDIRVMRADLLTARGKALAGLGRMDEALAAWREALAEARRQGARRAEWPALAALSEAEPDAAADYRRQAVEVIRYLESNLDEPELREAFLNLPDVRRILSEG
jgi:tetratricopeptide (TPR) repeat protein